MVIIELRWNYTTYIPYNDRYVTWNKVKTDAKKWHSCCTYILFRDSTFKKLSVRITKYNDTVVESVHYNLVRKMI